MEKHYLMGFFAVLDNVYMNAVICIICGKTMHVSMC